MNYNSSDIYKNNDGRNNNNSGSSVTAAGIGAGIGGGLGLAAGPGGVALGVGAGAGIGAGVISASQNEGRRDRGYSAGHVHNTMQVPPTAPQLFDPVTGQPISTPAAPAAPTAPAAPSAPGVPSMPTAPTAPGAPITAPTVPSNTPLPSTTEAPLAPATVGSTSTGTATTSCVSGFQQCTLTQPEGPTAYCYNPQVYACVQVATGNLICPAAAYAACGNGCYDPTQFTCNDGVLGAL